MLVKNINKTPLSGILEKLIKIDEVTISSLKENNNILSLEEYKTRKAGLMQMQDCADLLEIIFEAYQLGEVNLAMLHAMVRDQELALQFMGFFESIVYNSKNPRHIELANSIEKNPNHILNINFYYDLNVTTEEKIPYTTAMNAELQFVKDKLLTLLPEDEIESEILSDVYDHIKRIYLEFDGAPYFVDKEAQDVFDDFQYFFI